jgi:cell division protein FtsQ
LAAKQNRPNRYKPDAKPAKPPREHHSKFLFKVLSVVFMVAIMSLGAIWVHDAIVQSPYFAVTRIDISGNQRVSREELLARAGLNRKTSLFELHLPAVAEKLERHPWVCRADIRRRLFSNLEITIHEEEPLAIVTIENLPDIIINSQGAPFKCYDPEKDRLQGLPVISGVDLSLSDTSYGFEGELFNAIMELLKIKGVSQVRTIHGDENLGLTIKALDIYNNRLYKENTQKNQAQKPGLIPIKLGFDRFQEKLARARTISRVVETRFPCRTILAMDLYDIKKIFIKTKAEEALHNTLAKGV